MGAVDAEFPKSDFPCATIDGKQLLVEPTRRDCFTIDFTGINIQGS